MKTVDEIMELLGDEINKCWSKPSQKDINTYDHGFECGKLEALTNIRRFIKYGAVIDENG